MGMGLTERREFLELQERVKLLETKLELLEQLCLELTTKPERPKKAAKG